MWNGSLEKNTIFKHHINLSLDSRLAFQHPYQGGLKKEEHECQETEWMLKDRVI